MPGDLYFYIEGLLYLEKDGKVVETKLRFCLTTSCTTNITSSLNNIRPLAGTILRDPSLNEISQVELNRIKVQRWTIEGIGSVPINSKYR